MAPRTWRRSVGRTLLWIWARLGDASNLSWLLPGLWGKIIMAAAGMGTATLGILEGFPAFLWIPTSLCATLVALLIIAIIRSRFWEPLEDRPITSPRKRWMRLHVAPFKMPRNTEKHFLMNSREKLESRMCAAVERQAEGGRNYVFTARVNWDAGFFTWGVTNDASQPPQSFLSMPPWHMDASTPPFGSLMTPETWNRLYEKASWVWDVMRIEFNQLIHEGELKVWARIGSPHNLFSTIEPDIWRHYEIVDWGRGTAKCGNDALYSIHVEVMTKASAPSPLPLQGTGRKTQP